MVLNSVQSKYCNHPDLMQCLCQTDGINLYMDCETFPALWGPNEESLQTVSMYINDYLLDKFSYSANIWPELFEVYDIENKKFECWEGYCATKTVSESVTSSDILDNVGLQDINITNPNVETSKIYDSTTINSPTAPTRSSPANGKNPSSPYGQLMGYVTQEVITMKDAEYNNSTENMDFLTAASWSTNTNCHSLQTALFVMVPIMFLELIIIIILIVLYKKKKNRFEPPIEMTDMSNI